MHQPPVDLSLRKESGLMRLRTMASGRTRKSISFERLSIFEARRDKRLVLFFMQA